MTHDEARKLHDTHRRVCSLEEKMSALMELVNIYANRGKGRPTQVEVERVETLRGLIDGSPH